MADVRCPMCGKSNPEEAEKCLFCGEPLNAGGTFNQPEEPANDSADWLSGLRSGNWQADSTSPADEEETPADAANAADGTEIPDWLSRVRARSQENEPEGEAAQADDEPDWLKNLSANTEQSQGSADDWLAGLSPQPPADAQNEGETPPAVEGNDWLNNLRGTGQPEEAVSEPPAAAQAGGSSDDWMANLTDWNNPAEDKTPAAPADALPDFSNFSADTFAAADLPKAQNEDGLPDWFAQLTGNEAETPAPAAESNEPAWMPKPGSSQPLKEPGADENDLPAWLGGIAAASAAATAGAAQESAESAPAELPDWLSRATPGTSADETPAPAEALPDWLQSAEMPAAEPAPVPAQEETPDWFSQLNAGESSAEEPFHFDEEALASQPAQGAAEPATGLDAVPSFFAEDSAEQPALESQPAAADEAMPDFSTLLAGSGQDQGPLDETLSPDFSAADLPDWMGKPEETSAPAEIGEPAADLPAWMNDFTDAREPQAQVDPDEVSSPFVEEGLPAWLDGMKKTPGEVESSALIEPAEQELTPELNAPFHVELPAWMNEPQQAETSESAAQPASAELGDNLAKAELPSWVEDLRPLESVIPGDVRSDTGETLVEKAGPLAGMRGVLQGEDLTEHYRKPPVYSARLRVSDRQRSQAAILENLLGVETAFKEVPAEPSRAPQLILRIVIALVMILSLLSMLLPDFNLVNLPAAVPAGLSGVYDRVENLPADAAVLLAVDYEPGLSGEMRYSANSVIEHLMVKNARLAIVSTVPTGPVLADGLLTEVRNRRPDFVLADRTVNLGYLPGGTTSLLEFAQNPKRATPYAVDTPLSGLLAWDHPAVQGINSLQDFALVIVLTDNPETGRAWIEQVQPVLGNVPLTMITSAQAGPMLQPYFDSGQIQGMVVGLQGGAMYEQKSGRVNLANRFWGSYQTGVLAGILLLTLGGIISGVMGMSRRKPAQKGKA